MKREETRDEHGNKVVTLTIDDPIEYRLIMGFDPPDEPDGMRRNTGATITVSGSDGVPDYKSLVVYKAEDWVKPEPEKHPESAKEFLETCSKIEAMFKEVGLAENDWRDEGTEANKRVERLLAIVGVLHAAIITLIAGAGWATGAAVIYHSDDHANDWLFAVVFGIICVAWIAYMAGSLVLKRINAITEES